MSFQPAASLKSRTYIGLVIAQFLAAFNDQAIHASAMFFAIHTHTLSEAQAISLMPILFYAPWAIFCTIAGYLADRYSKRTALVSWKMAEIGIALIALAGFWLGDLSKTPLGPWVVLSTVFLMGTHSAFFVPAKYGVMPEVLQPHLLSRGNGLLESTSFLAVILGTVSGGVLSFLFRGREWTIGLILVALAILGALASLLIEKIPAANPGRPFPKNLFKPLWDNMKIVAASRPLALATIGIAFFTFIVAFMRATVYMLGESHNPKWTELQTSAIVGTVALGIGLGSPLAGFFSGGKIELGLVPLGAVGMILATVAAAFTLHWVPGLIVCIIAIGFFTGFYIVPQFTLLQHRAPRERRGDIIATTNFINVTGAILASLLFFIMVLVLHKLGMAPEVTPEDNWAHGRLARLDYDIHNHPAYFRIQERRGDPERQEAGTKVAVSEEDGDLALIPGDAPKKVQVIDIVGSVEPAIRVTPKAKESVGRDATDDKGSRVRVSYYKLRDVEHFQIRPEDMPLKPVYDNEGLPFYLFLSVSVLTLVTLVLLCQQLPDLFIRSLLWLRAQGRYRLKVAGLPYLPTDGPVILATNCDHFDDCMHVVAATDRFTRFVLLESKEATEAAPFLRYLARQTGFIAVPPGADAPTWDKAVEKARRALEAGNMIGLSANGHAPTEKEDKLLDELRSPGPVTILPVYCTGHEPDSSANLQSLQQRVRVVFGKPMKPGAPLAEIRQAIQQLKDQKDDGGGEEHIGGMH